MTKKTLTFEEALKQLENITAQIEQGSIGLEESISKYEEGMKLVRHCRKVLEKAEQKIEQLQTTPDKEPQNPEQSKPPDEHPDSSPIL
ncbi:MAG: exodeoxyribonuclease VII small subunit [Phycisphaerae bacterium]|nr:exodeoxyribonuclease VII small subunit [Phycisphaerae bacterium]